MADVPHWPACMRKATAAAYLDVSTKQFDRLGIPAIQLVPRGDRYFLKEDLDAFLEVKRREHVTAQRVA